MTLKASFVTVLRALRAKRNISQREFADTTSRTYLSRLEAGKSSITLDKLQQLSDRPGPQPTDAIDVDHQRKHGRIDDRTGQQALRGDSRTGQQG